jgi:hypothetical protein
MADFALIPLVILLATLLLILTWVLRPLWQRHAQMPESAPLALALLAEREASLASLRDLDFELQAGRIGSERHARLREDLLARGARVLSALDRLSEDRAGETARLTAALEAEVAALLAAGDHPRTICAGCGRPAAGGDRFCAGCGQALIAGSADATDVETPDA